MKVWYLDGLLWCLSSWVFHGRWARWYLATTMNVKLFRGSSKGLFFPAIYIYYSWFQIISLKAATWTRQERHPGWVRGFVDWSCENEQQGQVDLGLTWEGHGTGSWNGLNWLTTYFQLYISYIARFPFDTTPQVYEKQAAKSALFEKWLAAGKDWSLYLGI